MQRTDNRQLRRSPLASASIKDAERQLGLIWPRRMVPGDELLATKATCSRYPYAVFMNYRFDGIMGNAMLVRQTSKVTVDRAIAPPTRCLTPLATLPRAQHGPHQRSATVRSAHPAQPCGFPANCPTVAPRASPRAGLFGGAVAVSA